MMGEHGCVYQSRMAAWACGCSHVTGADMIIRIYALENCQMIVAPLCDIDRKQMNSC